MEWFGELAGEVQANPVLQGLMVALATLILEDPTSVGVGMLVAERRMAWMPAFVGLSLGIAAGDCGLYLLGRFAQRFVVSRQLVDTGRLQRAERWFSEHVIQAVIGARFLPGTRVPTFIGAGILRAPPWRFALMALAASTFQTLIVLLVAASFGQVVLSRLGMLKWPVVIGVVATVFVWHIRSAGTRRRREEALGSGEMPIASAFEFWPPALFYIPVVLKWIWLGLRHRHFSLPLVSNPSIYSSGMVGESKSQILSLVPEPWRDRVASYVIVSTRGRTPLEEIAANARAALAKAGLSYPIVAKPDIGQRGAGVRRVYDDAGLLAYFRRFPRNQAVMLQRLATAPRERSQPCSRVRFQSSAAPPERSGRAATAAHPRFISCSSSVSSRNSQLSLLQ